MLECPYCLAEVDPRATACRSCTRDLSGHIYLLRRVAALQESVSRLEAAATAPASAPVPPLGAERESGSAPAPVAAGRDAGTAGMVTIVTLLPIVLLTAWHHLLVFSLNAAPAWLLAASLITPIPFASAALLRTSIGLNAWLIAFLAVAVLAIVAMNADTAIAMADPDTGAAILPRTPAELRDDLLFGGSVFLSFVTGLLASLAYLLFRQPDHRQVRAGTRDLHLLGRHFSSALSMKSMERASKYVSALGAIGSAAAAVFLAIKRL